MSRASVAMAGLACAITAALGGCAIDQPIQGAAPLPDWSGYWLPEGPMGNIPVSGYPRAEEGETARLAGLDAPLKPEVAARLAPFTRSTSFEDVQKAAAADPELAALFLNMSTFKATGWGFPLMMESASPLQFLVTPRETLMINYYRDVRHVYTDGRPMPPAEDIWPSPWGTSVGHWEGDTLVIETVGVRTDFGIPLLPVRTDGARYVERIRMTGPDRIESEMTITDPATLTGPWVVKLAWRRDPATDRMFHDAFDNDRNEVEGPMLTIKPLK